MKERKHTVMQLRHDPGHCLAPGLFQTFKRGDRKNRKLDIEYKFNETTTLRFIGFEPLGADDLRILQGIVALAGTSKHSVDLGGPATSTEKQLTLLLEPKQEALKEKSAALRTTLQRLMAEVGYKTDGGDKREQIKESLRRLANVTTIVRQDKKEASSHLLSFYFDEKNDDLVVAVNPRLTRAIMGDQSYTHIDMREVRILESDPARLLHQRLCALVDPGKQRPIRHQTLISYIWPEPADGSTLRMRRQTVLKVLKELEQTGGWLFTENPAAGTVIVSRRKFGYVVPAPVSTEQEALL